MDIVSDVQVSLIPGYFRLANNSRGSKHLSICLSVDSDRIVHKPGAQSHLFPLVV